MKKLLCLICASISLHSFAVTDNGLGSLRVVKSDGRAKPLTVNFIGLTPNGGDSPLEWVDYRPLIDTVWVSGINYHASQTYDGSRPFDAYGYASNSIRFYFVHHSNTGLVRKFFDRHYGKCNKSVCKYVALDGDYPTSYEDFGSLGVLTIKFRDELQPYQINDIT